MLDDRPPDAGQEELAVESASDRGVLPEGIRPADYHLIEDAVMDTARGRWFLREYARRIRTGESEKLLAAIARLEKAVTAPDPSQFTCHNNGTIPLHVSAPAPGAAAISLGSAHQLISVQEKLLDIVWYMRERGFDGGLCNAIRGEAARLADALRPAAGGDAVDERSDETAAVVSQPVSDAHGQSLEDSAAGVVDGSNIEQKDCGPTVADGYAAGSLSGHHEVINSAPARENIAPAPVMAVARNGALPDSIFAGGVAVVKSPSKIAALAQKAAVFSAIDALNDSQKLALFY